MAKVAVLGRVSTREQRMKQSILTQKEFLETWSELHQHEIVDFYLDDGVSGTVEMEDWESKRPEAARLMRDVRAGLVEMVVVYKLDRIGRQVSIIFDFLEFLDETGVRFTSATENFNTETAMGRAFLGLIAVFAALERDTTTERTDDGRDRIVRAGYWHGGPEPFGYIKDQKRLTLRTQRIPGCDYSESEVVLMIFVWIIKERLSLTGVAKKLTALGIPSPSHCRPDQKGRKGRYHWRQGVVFRLVKSAVYYGLYQWGKEGGHEQIETQVPAIVDQETWAAAQAQLAANKRFAPRNQRRVYLLAGLVRCGHCGLAYCGTVWKNGRRMKDDWGYLCSGRARHKDLYGPQALPCHAPFVNGPELEAMVWQRLQDRAMRPQETLEELAERLCQERGQLHVYQREADTLRLQLTAKTQEKKRIDSSHRKGLLNDDEYAEQVKELRGEQEELESQIEAASVRVAEVQSVQQHLTTASGVLARMAAKLDHPLTETERKQFLQDAVVRLVIRGGKENRPQVELDLCFDEVVPQGCGRLKYKPLLALQDCFSLRAA
jgi:site-specific DNA recombinase